MKEPTPLECIANDGVLFVISSLLIGFAVLGIFAAIDEIWVRFKRYRYRKAHDERRGSKWTKIP
jgi:hypothetical protein